MLQSRVSASIRPCSFLTISQYARLCARPVARRVTVSSCSFLYRSLIAFEVPHDVIRYGRIPCQAGILFVVDPPERIPTGSSGHSPTTHLFQGLRPLLDCPVDLVQPLLSLRLRRRGGSLAIPSRSHLPESSHVRRSPSMDMAPPSTVLGCPK